MVISKSKSMKFTIRGLDWIVREIKPTNEAIVITIGMSPFLIFFAYIFLTGILSSDNDRACRREMAYSKQAYYGLILSVTNHKSSPSKQIEISDGTILTLQDSYFSQIDYTLVSGDTLEKKEGDLNLQVKSSQIDKVLTISLNQGCNND